MRYTFLEQTTSTNDEGRSERYGHGDVIVAERQTAGRGQRGNKWSSRPGENLMLSAVFEPRFLPAAEQFRLSKAVALALTDTLARYGIEARIKWTNDIYVGERKIVGILLENTLAGGQLARSVAGIGLNVNQTEFDPALPNPASMRGIAGRAFDRREVLDTLCAALERRYAQLEGGAQALIEADYHALLYRRDEAHIFRTPEGELFRATIRRVEPTGELVAELEEGELRSYLFRQIEFVIDERAVLLKN